MGKIYRIYLGPFLVGRVDLTYHKSEIRRGQKIRVTPEEAAAMDKLLKQWGVDAPPETERTVPEARAEAVEVKTKRKRKTRKRKEGNK